MDITVAVLSFISPQCLTRSTEQYALLEFVERSLYEDPMQDMGAKSGNVHSSTGLVAVVNFTIQAYFMLVMREHFT
jgi:hypothetical protein